MKELLLFVSGRGSNMLAIMDNLEKHNWPFAIQGVISDTDCDALMIANNRGYMTEWINRKKIGNDNFQTVMRERIRQFKPDLVALAGFMVILDKNVFSGLFDKMINIHPSLLPKYKGLNTHKRVIRDGAEYHGATVHAVSAGVDEGQIITQKKIKVKSGESPEDLAKRVLEVEHEIYPLTIASIMSERIIFKNGKWVMNDTHKSWPWPPEAILEICNKNLIDGNTKKSDS